MSSQWSKWSLINSSACLRHCSATNYIDDGKYTVAECLLGGGEGGVEGMEKKSQLTNHTEFQSKCFWGSGFRVLSQRWRVGFSQSFLLVLWNISPRCIPLLLHLGLTKRMSTRHFRFQNANTCRLGSYQKLPKVVYKTIKWSQNQ